MLLLLLFTLINMNNTLASEETVHNAWHSYIEEFIYNGSVVEVRIFPTDNNKVKVSYDGIPVFLTYNSPSNECRRINNLKFCYEDQTYDPENKADISYDGKLVPGIKLVIYNVYDKKQVSIAKKMTPANLRIGEEGKITVTVTNEGDAVANNVVMTEFLPKGIVLVKTLVKDFDVYNDRIVTKALIPAGKTYTYEYIVRMQALNNVKLPTNISYEFDSGDKFTKTQDFNIALAGFKVTHDFKPNSVDINRIAEYYIKVENLGDEAETINIDSLNVNFPLALRVIPISSQIKSVGYNDYFIQDSIFANQEVTYRFNVESDFIGEYDAYMDLEALAYDYRLRINETKTLDVGNTFVEPQLDISPKVLRAGNEVIIQAFIKNTQVNEIYYDVEAKIVSDILEKTITRDKILGQEIIDIYPEKRLRIPLASQEDELVFDLLVSFTTTSGERITAITEQVIKVFPASKSVVTTIEPEKKLMHLSDENTIVVNVKNLLQESLVNIDIRDQTSRPITIVSGTQEEIIPIILGGETLQGYIYKFKLPANFPDDQLNISTYITNNANNYQEIIVTTIEVNRTKITNEQTPEINETINVTNNQTDPEEDEITIRNKTESFWDKIGNFFKSLFTRR